MVGLLSTNRLGALVLASVPVLAGCGGGNSQANGAWNGCGDVSRPDKVVIQRTVSIAGPPSSLHDPHVATGASARALYLDICRTVAVKVTLDGPTSCPNDVGLHYLGRFFARARQFASFDWAASGCEYMSLTVSGQTVSTYLAGPASSEPASLEPDMAGILGVSVTDLHQPRPGE